MARKHVMEGYKVLDFSQVLAGPTTTRLLAEMGAEIIKVELAPAGDTTRVLPWSKNGRSGYFIQQNRGKKSLCLDAKDPRGLEILKELVKEVDILLESFAPGAIKRMGLSWDVVKEINPRVVMCSVSAFGQDGPLTALPGFDFVAAAYAGILDMIGYADGPPMFVGLAMGDVNAGVHALAAINAALLERTQTNEGQYIDISLLDSYFHMHEINVQAYSGSEGKLVPKRSGNQHATVCPLGIFKGKDDYLFILCLPQQWEKMCKLLERPDMVEDPRYATNDARVKNLEGVKEAIESFLAKQESDEAAIKKFNQAHLAIAPILSVAQAMQHPHLVERNTVRPITDRGFGDLKIPGMPLRFSKYPDLLDLQAPYLGEHNHDVLSGTLGYSDAKIEELTAAGVLRAEPIPQ